MNRLAILDQVVNSGSAFPTIEALHELKELPGGSPNLFFRPESYGITPIWYKLNTDNTWEWTPYDPAKFRVWYYVSEETVNIGKYEGYKPAPENLNIIRKLRERRQWGHFSRGSIRKAIAVLGNVVAGEKKVALASLDIVANEVRDSRSPVFARLVSDLAALRLEVAAEEQQRAAVLATQPNRFCLDDQVYQGHVTLAIKHGSLHFAETSASKSVDRILSSIMSGKWFPPRPIVITLCGRPGTGKNELVRRFARLLWQHYMTLDPNFTEYDHFFKEFNLAQMTTPETISRLMGASRQYVGGPGDLVRALEPTEDDRRPPTRRNHDKAQVFYFDEFNRAHSTIVKSLGGLFEDGYLIDNSGTRGTCAKNTVIFLAANDIQNTQRDLSGQIIKHPAFKQEKGDQANLWDGELSPLLEEYKKAIFSEGLEFIGDRCFELLLCYQDDTSIFRQVIVQKFLHEASSQIKAEMLGWTDDVVAHFAKRLDPATNAAVPTNRSIRGVVCKALLHTICEVVIPERNAIFFDVKSGKITHFFVPISNQMRDALRLSEAATTSIPIPLTPAEAQEAYVRSKLPRKQPAGQDQSGGLELDVQKSAQRRESTSRETSYSNIIGMPLLLLAVTFLVLDRIKVL